MCLDVVVDLLVECGDVGICFVFFAECVSFCMSCLMWIGSGVNLFCWLPLGMWCLSAWSMTCVMIRFALCTSVVAGSRCMACSISCVNACQFAFL